MQKSFQTEISGYTASFKLEDNLLIITLKSIQKKIVLFGRFSQDNIPNDLQNFVDSPVELYDLINALKQNKMEVQNQTDLILPLQMAHKTKVFRLALEKTSISNEEVLARQNDSLRKQNEQLKKQNEEMRRQNYELKLELENSKTQINELKNKPKDVKIENSKSAYQMNWGERRQLLRLRMKQQGLDMSFYMVQSRLTICSGGIGVCDIKLGTKNPPALMACGHIMCQRCSQLYRCSVCGNGSGVVKENLFKTLIQYYSLNPNDSMI